MANFHPDDIIRLARANRGYGFRRFLKELYGKKRGVAMGGRRESQVLRLFDIHKQETGEDLFGILQDPSKTVMITRQEWMDVTGGASPPRGSGLSTSRKSSLERVSSLGSHSRDIPLPPQDFDWIDVEEVPKDEFVNGSGSTSHKELLDCRAIIRMNDVDMLTERQISERTGYSERIVSRFLKNLVRYDQHGVSNDWVRVQSFLWDAQAERGGDHLSDEIMMDLRGIFRDYLEDPINIEAPTDEDLHWVFDQLKSESMEHEEYPEEIDLDEIRKGVMIEAQKVKEEREYLLKVKRDVSRTPIPIRNSEFLESMIEERVSVCDLCGCELRRENVFLPGLPASHFLCWSCYRGLVERHDPRGSFRFRT